MIHKGIWIGNLGGFGRLTLRFIHSNEKFTSSVSSHVSSLNRFHYTHPSPLRFSTSRPED